MICRVKLDCLREFVSTGCLSVSFLLARSKYYLRSFLEVLRGKSLIPFSFKCVGHVEVWENLMKFQ